MQTKESSNTKQALWIGLGSLSSFGFSIISAMILSRYLDKESYGTYKQVLYVYNSLLMIFTLCLPQAFGYFLPRVPKVEGRSVVNKITNVLLILGSVFAILLFLGASTIASFLKNDNLVDAIKLFSLVPFFLLPTMGLESIYATYRQTQIVTIYTFSTRIILLICVVCPVIIFHQGYMGALLGFLLASFFNFIIALYLKSRPFKGLKHKVTSYTYKDIFKFCLPLAFAAIWGMLINSSDQYFISHYFGTITFAEFSNGAMELPFVGMIVSACSTVLYPLFSKYDHEGTGVREKIFPVWQSVFRKTALIVYPLVIFCWFFATEIMTLLYGSKYAESGVFFRIKLIANFFTIIAFSPLILAIGKLNYYAKVHMCGAIILIVLEYISVKTIDNAFIVTGISVICQIGRIIAMLVCVANYFGISLIALFPWSVIGKVLIPSSIFLTTIKCFIPEMSDIISIITGACIYAGFMGILSYIFKFNYLGLAKSILK